MRRTDKGEVIRFSGYFRGKMFPSVYKLFKRCEQYGKGEKDFQQQLYEAAEAWLSGKERHCITATIPQTGVVATIEGHPSDDF